MIKVLLKHLIFERCIDVLFDKIFYNFASAKVEFRAGDKFYFIKHGNENHFQMFYNVIIKNFDYMCPENSMIAIVYTTSDEYRLLPDNKIMANANVVENINGKRYLRTPGVRCVGLGTKYVMDYKRV